MRKVNPTHAAELTAVINAAPYFQLMSMEIRELGAGYCIAEIQVSRRHYNPFGGVHGGLFSSAIDSAASWALFYEIEDETAGLSTVELNVRYLSPGIRGKVIAEGRQIRMGKTLGYAECTVSGGDGKTLAFGTLTAMVMPGSAPSLGPPVPRKFLADAS